MTERYMAFPRTLVFLFRGGEVLLIERSQSAGLFPGMYNGVGGHVERGENILESARREVQEETGLEVTDLTLRGIIHADEGWGAPGALVFVFVGEAPTRDVTESNEGRLHWISMDELATVRLMPDLVTLLPRLWHTDPGAGLFFTGHASSYTGSTH
jgi:8-oxo-dGTP diphosphatase